MRIMAIPEIFMCNCVENIISKKQNFFFYMIVLLFTVFKMIYGCKLMHRSTTLLLPRLCHIYTYVYS